MRNVIIVGSGPAAYTAALYTSRANLKPFCIEGALAGGQLMLTTMVENYPGFPEGILGPGLMEKMRQQAERFGTEWLRDDVTKVDFKQRPFTVWVGDQAIQAKAVIISTGASSKWIGLESEKQLIGYGVSSCATCDAAFFKEKEVLVVGGGDSAMEEAIFLTKFATKVTVIHRRDALRASKIMQDRALANKKIAFQWNAVVDDIFDPKQKKVTGARLKSTTNGKTWELKCDGVFVAIGHVPNTEIFKGQIELDQKGYVVVKPWSSETSVPGVFVAGDVHDHRYKQAVTAAGFGCMAALDAEKYLESLGDQR